VGHTISKGEGRRIAERKHSKGRSSRVNSRRESGGNEGSGKTKVGSSSSSEKNCELHGQSHHKIEDNKSSPTRIVLKIDGIRNCGNEKREARKIAEQVMTS
jgi:hypothetical protein